MNISDELKISFKDAQRAILSANKICIISHRSPDGDAVGANLALRGALEALGKIVVSACVDPVPADSLFLKGAETFVSDFHYEDFDLIISVDCGALGLVKFHESKPELTSGKIPFLNIDHHSSNENFGTINIVDPKSCATCYILFFFFEFCGWKINIDMATALLHGIYFDTGSLMHSNTTASVYEVAGKLILRGADLRRIIKHLFKSIDVNKLRLWGRILERAYVNDEGVAISAVDRNDYFITGASHKDTGGAIDYLNTVPDTKYCVLLSEDDKGRVKGSLRTQREDINLSDVASQWGGGGHPKASGFGVEGSLKQVTKWQIVKENGNKEKIEF